MEAAWKYVIICSTGIALALLGTFLLNYAAQHAPTPTGLDWVGLTAAAPDLDPGVTRIAVLLLVLGFGTKAGLAPLHAWLPDAHSPGPGAGVRADVRGADLGRLLRDPAGQDHRRRRARPGLHPRPADRAVAGIDHGRRVIADGAAGLQADAGLLQHREHGPARARRGHRQPAGDRRGAAAHPGPRAGQERAVPVRRPDPAAHRVQPDRPTCAAWPPGTRCWPGVSGFGVLAIIAFPPFSLFASELGIATAGFAAGLGWATAAALILVLVIAAALVGSHQPDAARRPHPGPRTAHRRPARRGAGTRRRSPPARRARRTRPALAAGEPRVGVASVAVAVAPPVRRALASVRRRPGADSYALVAALVVCGVLGLTLGPLAPLLEQATAIVTGTAP